MAKSVKRFMEGNIAICEGAMAAGSRFYAGYPISPSSEIAEHAAKEMPRHGGLYVQMEDEISSMAALLGAGVAGQKAFTATSGPGFSLMQENLGLGVMSEIPCVIVDVQRSGPSTGAATKPAQADLMQARWGTHGDHSIIAVAPSSVQDCYDLTITAFNYAEKYRTPVIILADEAIGHLRETCTLRPAEPAQIFSRRQPEEGTTQETLRTYDYSGNMPGPMPRFGDPRFLSRTTGSTHDEKGEFGPSPGNMRRVTEYLTRKIEANVDDITIVRKYYMEDAGIVMISFGCSARSALGAVKRLRAEGLKAGMLQLLTVWPLPEKEIRAALKQAKYVFVPEMNLGQLTGEVKKCNDYGVPVININRTDGTLLSPAEIAAAVKEVL